MIQSYQDKRTRDFANGKRVKAFQGFDLQAQRRLTVLEDATSLEDLMQVSSNHLEALHGDRQGQLSIRINRQWRICFVWSDETQAAFDVEIVDYH